MTDCEPTHGEGRRREFFRYVSPSRRTSGWNRIRRGRRGGIAGVADGPRPVGRRRRAILLPPPGRRPRAATRRRRRGRADADGQAHHLPLSAALKAFAARPAALKRILAPLEEAGRTDSFLAGLLESRRIFQPCALTIAEAYRFLKGITGYETAGLLVRTGRLWAKQPTRAQVTVSVGKTPGGGLTAQSLCSFDAAGDSDGGLMRTVRLRLGLSQAEMGQRFGTYQAIISQIERGKARLRPGWAERLREMALHGK